MITLKHAFDANSMKGLVLKILRGVYPPIDDSYSPDLRNIIAEMLNKDPKKRPSVKRILEKDFLAERIQNLIPMNIVKHELGQTFINNHVNKPKEPQPQLTFEPLAKEEDSKPKRGLSRDNSHVQLPSSEVLQIRDINLDSNRNRVLQPNRNSYSLLDKENRNSLREQRDSRNSRNSNDSNKELEKQRSSHLKERERQEKHVLEVKPEKEEGYNELLSSIKEVLNRDARKPEKEDLGVESNEQRTFQHFLAPDGKRLEFEGLDEKDSI